MALNVGASKVSEKAAKAPRMRRWLTMIASLMLAVMVWTGGVAHAAEAFTCAEVSATEAGHFNGDEDQTPSDSGKAVTHHHSGCHGHHNLVPLAFESKSGAIASYSLLGLGHDAVLIDRQPPTALRPPIA